MLNFTDGFSSSTFTKFSIFVFLHLFSIHLLIGAAHSENHKSNTNCTSIGKEESILGNKTFIAMPSSSKSDHFLEQIPHDGGQQTITRAVRNSQSARTLHQKKFGSLQKHVKWAQERSFNSNAKQKDNIFSGRYKQSPKLILLDSSFAAQRAHRKKVVARSAQFKEIQLTDQKRRHPKPFGLQLTDRKENRSESSYEEFEPQKNIVEENPSLDVGPLVVVHVGKRDTARLPCTRRPLPRDNAVRLVLWYRNHTSRPLLSFDSRESFSRRINTTRESSADYPIDSDNHLFLEPTKPITPPNEPRLSLRNKGRTLVITDAQMVDESEYRCVIHFSRSPATTHRLKLIVLPEVTSLTLVDAAGQKVNTRVGPFNEGRRLTLTCQAKFIGRLVELQWLVGGQAASTSWSNPGHGFAESLLDMTLEPRHSGEELTCRLITARGKKMPGRMGAQQRLRDASGRSGANITDLSTVVLLKYLPRVRLEFLEPRGQERSEGAQGGVNVKVSEGKKATILCRVRASPPPYNITWMINGTVLADHSTSLGDIRNTIVTTQENRINIIYNTRRHPLTSSDDPLVDLTSHYNISSDHYQINDLFRSKTVASDLSHLSLSSNKSILHLKPVRKSDAGLYTCLASNSEGDGQSNAGLVKVTHAPHCKSKPARNPIVIGRNSSITLVCEVSSEPQENVTFFWITQKSTFYKSRTIGKGGIITGENPAVPMPGLIDLVPTPSDNHGIEGDTFGGNSRKNEYQMFYSAPNRTQLYNLDRKSLEKNYKYRIQSHYLANLEIANASKMHPEFPTVKESDVLSGRVDANDPRKSFLTLIATETTNVLCYARNSEGRSQIPCTYVITVVDPPPPPKGCSVEESPTGGDELRVTCEGGDDESSTQHIPGLSYVRSPQSRTSTILEVWKEDRLLLNTSSDRASFQVTKLPADSALQLLLFTVSNHAKSLPLVLHLKTRPKSSYTTQVNLNSNAQRPSSFLFQTPDVSTNVIIGCIAGIVATIISLITICTLIIIYRKKNDHETEFAQVKNLSVSPDSSRNSSNNGSTTRLAVETNLVSPHKTNYMENTADHHQCDPPDMIPYYQSPNTVPLSGSSFPLLMQSDTPNYDEGNIIGNPCNEVSRLEMMDRSLNATPLQILTTDRIDVTPSSSCALPLSVFSTSSLPTSCVSDNTFQQNQFGSTSPPFEFKDSLSSSINNPGKCSSGDPKSLPHIHQSNSTVANSSLLPLTTVLEDTRTKTSSYMPYISEEYIPTKENFNMIPTCYAKQMFPSSTSCSFINKSHHSSVATIPSYNSNSNTHIIPNSLMNSQQSLLPTSNYLTPQSSPYILPRTTLGPQPSITPSSSYSYLNPHSLPLDISLLPHSSSSQICSGDQSYSISSQVGSSSQANASSCSLVSPSYPVRSSAISIIPTVATSNVQHIPQGTETKQSMSTFTTVSSQVSSDKI